jgi:hypothetical protein
MKTWELIEVLSSFGINVCDECEVWSDKDMEVDEKDGLMKCYLCRGEEN